MNLLAELARLLRLMDPMPPRVVADAEAAGRLLLPPWPGEAETAGLAHLDDADLLAVQLDAVPAVRSGGRRLRLGPPGGEVLLDVEIRQVGPALRIAGLAPPGARLAVRWPDGGADVPVDGAGFFTTEAPAGRVRLLLGQPGRRPSTTGWL